MEGAHIFMCMLQMFAFVYACHTHTQQTSTVHNGPQTSPTWFHGSPRSFWVRMGPLAPAHLRTLGCPDDSTTDLRASILIAATGGPTLLQFELYMAENNILLVRSSMCVVFSNGFCQNVAGFFGFSWISLDLSGFVWIWLDLLGFGWISLDLSGFPWICLDFHGFVWNDQNNRNSWIRLESPGITWNRLESLGFG